MSNIHLLEEYEAKPLVLEDLPTFDRQALPFFTDEDLFDNPFIDFSFHHDISKASMTFEQLKCHIPHATLTGFLFWCAAKSLCSIRQANFRKCGDTWYELGNPPFFMPVATGKDSRLASTFLKNVKNSTFESFTQQYHETVQRAQRGEEACLSPIEAFNLAHNLVNLPNLRFTNVKPHSVRRKSTHVWWIFGQRYEERGSLFVPMTIRMHHANGDPVILERIMQAFATCQSSSDILRSTPSAHVQSLQP